MNITDRQTFIMAFQDEFKDAIANIIELDKDSFGNWSYRIDLKEGIDKNKFTNTILPFVNGNSAFEESFDLWINGYGDDFDSNAMVITVNGDYSDSSREFSGIGDDDWSDFEYKVSIEVNGVIYNVADNDEDDEPGEYCVYINEDYIGSVFAEFDEEGNLVWNSKDLAAPDVVKAIGEAIEADDLQ